MKKSKKVKKQTNLYDANGNWVEEKTRIKGGIRRTFRLAPQMKEILQKARVELPPALKKDGTPGARPQVRYRCAYCNGLFSQKNVQVDHIEPAVPLYKSEESMTYDELVRGIFCKVENLQVLCSTPIKKNNGQRSCHQLKTDKEKYFRTRFRELNLNLKSTDINSWYSILDKEYSELKAKKASTKKSKK